MKKHKLLLCLGAGSLLSVLPAISGACVVEKGKTPEKPVDKKPGTETTTPGDDNKLTVAGYIKEDARVAVINKKELPAKETISDEIKKMVSWCK
ncbi:hypothetical protein C4M96_02290 [Mycoplasmopsis pullorum]|uniref:hypothetical protein n=1 Tax=Mycoplasmopsis pullorum TaxID=48003 RepID=UPI00111BA18C|nr:hypothetical protein [Mycoplasmopsis pullorum]TNK82806.1 hypothetical protein C4M93_03480 [Mycoplasmopsis pullorum]TNK92041.1 hypothetical protein C4M96_02290 [Mycoplasmopsis pullorum]